MDALELTRRLVRRPSITPDDKGCQQEIAARLKPLGFTIETMRFGAVDNLWARRGTQRPTLVFAGHTDVVPPGPLEAWQAEPFAATVTDDGRLIGRGAADMKASLAAMITAAAKFITLRPASAGSLAFLITSDEEGAADDGTVKVMEALDRRGELFDYCVVGEPSSAARLGDTVRNGRRGSLTGLMTIRGAQGHVAYPLDAENPMHAFARFAAAMTSEPIDRGNEYFPPTTFQMVNVHADADAPNVVPGELRCRFNFRFSTEWTPESLAARVESLLDRLGIEYEITWRLAGAPFLTQRGTLTDVTSEAIRSVIGIEPELSTSGGTSDGRFIAPYGIEVVELGPINATIHKVNEEVRIEEIFALETIYLEIMKRLLR
jgi:succinyl-diaminopimelate desuccinylase